MPGNGRPLPNPASPTTNCCRGTPCLGQALLWGPALLLEEACSGGQAEEKVPGLRYLAEGLEAYHTSLQECQSSQYSGAELQCTHYSQCRPQLVVPGGRLAVMGSSVTVRR